MVGPGLRYQVSGVRKGSRCLRLTADRGSLRILSGAVRARGREAESPDLWSWNWSWECCPPSPAGGLRTIRRRARWEKDRRLELVRLRGWAGRPRAIRAIELERRGQSGQEGSRLGGSLPRARTRTQAS